MNHRCYDGGRRRVAVFVLCGSGQPLIPHPHPVYPVISIIIIVVACFLLHPPSDADFNHLSSQMDEAGGRGILGGLGGWGGGGNSNVRTITWLWDLI